MYAILIREDVSKYDPRTPAPSSLVSKQPDEITVKAHNKTEARQLGQLYIKQWQLYRARIDYIRELPTIKTEVRG